MNTSTLPGYDVASLRSAEIRPWMGLMYSASTSPKALR
jgi:hypothetical protein